MKNLFNTSGIFASIICIILISSLNMLAQDPSAIMDLESSSQGVLVPRMTEAQRTGIALPAKGLLVYQIDGVAGFYYNSGSSAAPSWALLNAGADVWATNGDHIYKTNTGNVGVGTSNPQHSLSVGKVDGASLALGATNFNTSTSGSLVFSEDVENATGDCGFRFDHNGSANTLTLVSGCFIPNAGDTLMNFYRNGGTEIKNLRVGAINVPATNALSVTGNVDVSGDIDIQSINVAGGKVGIGTSTPASAVGNAILDVVGGHILVDNDFGFFSKKVDNTIGAGIDTRTDNSLQLYTNGSSRVTVDATGNVGIGTATPSWPLQVVGGIGGGANANPNWYVLGSAATSVDAFTGPGGGWSYTIHSSGAVYSGFGFATGSDARIKNILSVSNGQSDLDKLMNIEVTDYQMKDEIKNGDQVIKKVIAQQVETVLPNAITKARGVVPDIYQKATVSDNWIELATNLKIGENVKIMTEDSENIYRVSAVQENKFMVEGLLKEKQTAIFVYGREVDDFRSVDYDAISMLHVSATQEQQRVIEAQQKEIELLKNRLVEIDELKAQMRKLSAALNSNDRMLAADTSK